ncbi:hypothetical protein CYK37_19750 [Mesorhizobium loti]|nr:hypothetical protein CYK37_19750 [Mesorhizobium loti]
MLTSSPLGAATKKIRYWLLPLIVWSLPAIVTPLVIAVSSAFSVMLPVMLIVSPPLPALTLAIAA